MFCLLLVAKGIATRNKNATRGAPGLTTRSKKLLVTRALLLVKRPLVVKPFAPSSFLLLLVRHLSLEAMHLFLVASLLLVKPFVPSSEHCYY